MMFALGAALAMAQSQPGDNLPMYGQPGIVRPDDLKKADAAFARQATTKYGSPGAASRVWAGQGWSSMREGKPDLALEQFNRAWLLNSKNYQAFWGFGAVLSEQGKLEAAVEQLSIASQLIDEPAQKAALLSDLGSVYSELAARLPEDSSSTARNISCAPTNPSPKASNSIPITRRAGESGRFLCTAKSGIPKPGSKLCELPNSRPSLSLPTFSTTFVRKILS